MSQLTLTIDGVKFEYFNNFTVNLQYNGLASTFSFSGLFDPNDRQQVKLFRPLQYHKVQVKFENVLLITGVALSTVTGIADKQQLANISGYSLPGVLQDCEIDKDQYPLEFNGLSLKEITNKLILPFGLKLRIDSSVKNEVEKVFDQIAAESSQNIKDFLSDLAKQRNVILTHTKEGYLYYTKLKLTKSSIATYRQDIPTTSIGLSVNGQGLHSKISVLKQATLETDATGEASVDNDLVKVFRPTVKDQTSGDNDDTIKAAQMVRGSELRNIRLTINTDRWKWFDGRKLHIIQPNNIIDVISPDNFLPKRTRFFVETVVLNGDEKSTTAEIQAVLPETYTGNQPKNLFK